MRPSYFTEYLCFEDVTQSPRSADSYQAARLYPQRDQDSFHRLPQAPTPWLPGEQRLETGKPAGEKIQDLGMIEEE